MTKKYNIPIYFIPFCTDSQGKGYLFRFVDGTFFRDWDCGYSVPPKRIVVFDTKPIQCNARYRFGNTLRFPRVTREPPCPGKGYAATFSAKDGISRPSLSVLWGLTLATFPAGVFVYFLRWFCALHVHHIHHI